MVNPNRFYTYAYLRKDRTPYYIGKGNGDRVYRKRSKGINAPKDKNRIIAIPNGPSPFLKKKNN